MSNDEEQKPSTAIARRATQLVGALGGAGVGSLVGGSLGGPGGAATGALVGAGAQQAWDILAGRVFDRRENRKAQWFNHLLQTKAGEDLQEEIRAHLPDERTVAVLAESLTAVDQAIADRVVPVLADLLAQYRGPPPQPDWYFRGMNRVLRDLSDEEFDALRTIVGTLVDIRADWPELVAVEQEDWVHKTDEIVLGYVHPRKNPAWIPIDPFPHVQRLFYLLKSNGIGDEGKTGGLGGGSGPGVLHIKADLLARVAELLIPSA